MLRLVRTTLTAWVALLCLPAGAETPNAAVTHLAEAVRIPTISHQEPAQIDVGAFEGFLAWAQTTYPQVFATLESERVNRFSLLMRWPGTDDTLAPVLFDSHYDVVPIEPGTEGDWTHPPFSGELADGFLWGRGSVDDKIAVVTTLEALETLIANGYAPTRTIYFSFVHDEEIGGEAGAGAVATLLLERGIGIDYVVGEGGGVMRDNPLLPGRETAMIALGEKTYLTLILRASGSGGHSSMPPRDSSIVRLARAVTRLHENPFEPRMLSIVEEMLVAVGEHSDGIAGIALRNPWLTRPILVSQLAKDPVGSSMVRTTTAVTMIDAGVKENVVPQRAEARVNFRVLPDEAPEDVIEAVRALIDDPAIELISRPWQGNPGIADVSGEGYRRIRAALESVVPDVVVMPGMMMATTDSRHYAKLTPDIYRFHPMTLDAGMANAVHGTDERISIDGIQRGVEIYRALIRGAGAD